MKWIKAILLTLVISITFSNQTNAQFLKKLKQKVEKAAEDVVIEKASEKAAQEAGKAMDSLLDIDPNYQANNQEQLINMYMQNDSTITVEDVYNFHNNVIYKMTTVSNGTPSTLDYSMWFSDNKNYMATEMKNINSKDSKSKNEGMEMLTILDEKNQAMIVIMEKQKFAQVISMSKIKEIAIKEEGEELKTNLPEIKKTGKSKKILGYHCEEFSTLTNDGTMSIWVTQDVKLYQKNMFLNLSKSLGGNTFQDIPNAAKGFMMEMHYENKSEDEKGTMVVIGISKKTKIIHTKDYQMMNLSMFLQN
jgi:hypothetical protein